MSHVMAFHYKKQKPGASSKGKCLGDHSGLEGTHSQNIPELSVACLPSLRAAALQSQERKSPQVSCGQPDQSPQSSIVCGSAGSAWDEKSLLEQTTVHLTASHSVLLGSSHLAPLSFRGSRS